MMQPLCVVENLTKQYPKFNRARWQSLKSALLKGELRKSFQPHQWIRALHNLSFTIHPGEILGVIGRNGAGKSTLLKCVAGLLRPTQGSIYVGGKTASLIELGAGFHPELSGYENSIINGVMLGLKKREIFQRMDKIMAFSELGEFIHQPIKTYSTGMLLRLSFSIAIHVDADLLLVDEVLAVGDEAFARKCLQRIGSLLQKGVGILLVSHDLSLISQVCQRALWLHQGKLKAYGDAREVVQAYRAFLGEIDNLQDVPSRWGNHKMVIQQVKLVNPQDQPVTLQSSPGELKLVIQYEAPKRVEDWVIGFALHKQGTGLVYGTNSHIEGRKMPPIQGKGKVIITFPKIDLPDGDYYWDVALHSQEGEPYDYWTHCLAFKVVRDLRDEGTHRIPHIWTFDLPSKMIK